MLQVHHLQDTLGWDAFWGNETVKGLLGRGRALMLDGKRVANKNEELINKVNHRSQARELCSS